MSSGAVAPPPAGRDARAHLGPRSASWALELIGAHTTDLTASERTDAVTRVLGEAAAEDAQRALVTALAQYGAALAETASTMAALPMPADIDAADVLAGLARLVAPAAGHPPAR